jgi:hypothetical protein
MTPSMTMTDTSIITTRWPLKMSKLDVAMKNHMEYLVLTERRSFCVVDFRRFEVNGLEYRMSSGTFRNKISLLKRAVIVEPDFKSVTAFYTLAGHKGTQAMTRDRAVGPISLGSGRRTAIYKWIKNIPLEKQSLHNIRCTFEAKGIWDIFFAMYPERYNDENKDINLESWLFLEDIDVKVTIHHTDTVSVALACSARPLALDVEDIMTLIEVLVRSENRLSSFVGRHRYSKTGELNPAEHSVITIPRYTKWTGRMWHFGADEIDEYDGEDFHVTIEEGVGDLFRIYTKRRRDNTVRRRVERQEYPNNPITTAILEKLYSGEYRSDV